MSKLEKIYAGFYAYSGYSIERKFGDNWYICDCSNKVIGVKWTLKDCVMYIKTMSVGE